MKKNSQKIIIYILSITILIFCAELPVFAFNSVLPSAGIDFTLGDNSSSIKDLQDEVQNQETFFMPSIPVLSVAAIPTATPGSSSDELINSFRKAEETNLVVLDKSLRAKERELELRREEEGFKNLVIARVTNYVNVRNQPGEDGEIVGKLYNNSVGNLLSEQDGWYEIKSGNVVGFVKGEFCVTGEAAIDLAKEVGTRIATVNTTTLKVRKEPSTDAIVLGLIPLSDDLLVLEELEDWVKVNIEEGDGFVHADFVDLSTEFVRAESREEEAARLAQEAADRRAAQQAAQRAANRNAARNNEAPVVYATGGGSELGRAVANYGLQFVGNPYRYGGNSLTNGIDCSGFVKAVHAHFGVDLPRTSGSQRRVGTAVDGIGNAQPGDIICYSGHVGIYIGDGKIVHASTAQTGIIVSNASYRRILAVRRIF